MLTFEDKKTKNKKGVVRTFVDIGQRITSGEDAHTEFKTSFGDEVIVALVAFANANEAIREIVMNMIVHRDYRSPSDSIIKIFPDHILFFNPGSLQEPITVERLMQNDYVSVLRNKQIANIFKTAGDIEKYGTGVKRVCQMFLDYGLPVPKWEMLPEGMVVTVFIGKNAEASSSDKGDSVDVTENHPENQKSSQKGSQKSSQKSSQKILTLLLKDSQITTQEIANELGISRRAVAKQIANMSKKGLISRIGPDKGGYWQVNDNVDTKTKK